MGDDLWTVAARISRRHGAAQFRTNGCDLAFQIVDLIELNPENRHEEKPTENPPRISAHNICDANIFFSAQPSLICVTELHTIGRRSRRKVRAKKQRTSTTTSTTLVVGLGGILIAVKLRRSSEERFARLKFRPGSGMITGADLQQRILPGRAVV